MKKNLLALLIVALSMPGFALAGAPALHGVDIAGMDTSVKPGDDMEAYASGTWLKNAQIPADRSSYGVFYLIFQKAEKRTADLIKEAGASNPAAGTDARRISDYYAAFMDEAAAEKRGLDPVKPQLAAIANIATRADLSRMLGEQMRADVDPVNATRFHTDHLFGLFVTQALDDPSREIGYLLQGGLGMPDRDYYLSTDKDMVDTRTKYRAYIAALLKLADQSDADAKAQRIFDLETKIATVQANVVDSQDVHKVAAPWPLAAYATKAPGIDWNAYFKASALDHEDRIVAWQPDALVKLSALVGSEPLQAWKDWLAFHAIDDEAPKLSKAYVDLHFGFHENVLNGTPAQQPRWKRGVAATNADLADAVGQLYVQRYFPASSKAQVQQLVANLMQAFDDRVDQLAWMTPATRAKAKAKIATLKVGVGYPEHWRDYSGLVVRADDPVGNHERATLLEYRHQLAKLHAAPDRMEWWMSPQTVNAVNLPLQNALNFPAAILEAPFFDPSADPACNYGAIGAIIGHEISHSFDNTGAEFDADGRLANWWTPDDQAHFKAASQKLVAQYNAYEALPGLHVNGEQTLGENIADVSGLTIAFAAYEKSLGGKPAPVIDGMTGEQRFFIAFAQAWRNKVRDAALRGQVVTNEHSPSRFRAFTVRNVDGWYDALSPKPGEKLYLAPADRVKIW